MIKCLKALWVLSFAAFSVALQAQKVHPWHIDGEIYLKYNNDFPITQLLKEINTELPALPGFGIELTQAYGIHGIEAPFAAATDIKLKQTLRIYFSKSEGIDELRKLLAANPVIEYAEPVPYNTTGYTPNDIGSNTTTGQWGLYKIKAREAWDISKGNSTIKVAIVDDGMFVGHTDLNANVWRNPGEIAGNKIDDDNNGYVDDIYGYDVGDKDPDPFHPNTNFTHGTHVGGIAGAVSDNGIGVASIGYNISIMGVKCTFNAQTSTASIPMGYEGMTYAANAGADIINCSWSSSAFSQTAQNVVDYAVSKGCIVVAAASNDGVEQIRYPAAYTGVIAVASTDINDNKSSFSNYGTWVDVSAPGSRIRSTVATGGYSIFDGTSMATPMVVGLLGLMKSHNPNITNSELEQCLLDNADKIDAINQAFAGKIGKGRINAEKSLQCVDATLNVKPQARVQAAITVACPNTQVDFYGSSTKGKVDSFKWYFIGGTPATSTLANPSVTYTGKGKYDVALVVTNANGTDSSYLPNYIDVSANGREVIYSEDFESGTLASMGYTIKNPDNSTTWTLVTAGGLKGSVKSLRMNCYNYNKVGERDAVLTPIIDLSKNANTLLSFQHAYRAQNTTKRDSLIIYISTDSGQTFTDRVAAFAENGTLNFATRTISATSFTPTLASDWCVETLSGAGCFDIDLSDYDGLSGIVLKFESYNDFGNNLFIDNIMVTGNCSSYNTDKPKAEFANNDTVFCLPGTVNFNDKSANFATSYQWIFDGGDPATSTVKNPVVSYTTPGNYDVTLIVNNAFGYDTIELKNYIVAAPAPTVGVSADTTIICRGKSTKLIATGAQDYFWFPVFALSATAGDTVTVTPPSSFTYNVKGTSQYGCTDTKTITITVLLGPGNTPIYRNRDSLYTTNNTVGVNFQWLLEGNEVPGQKGKSIKPGTTAPGNYSLRATDSAGCVITSSNYYFNPLSVGDINSNDAIKVYPNPASGSLYIETEEGNAVINIYNILGEKIYSASMPEKQGVINTKSLSDGMYFVSVQSGVQNIVQKIMVRNE